MVRTTKTGLRRAHPHAHHLERPERPHRQAPLSYLTALRFAGGGQKSDGGSPARPHGRLPLAPSLDRGRLFADDAVTAIHQSSGWLLRRAGNLACGALLSAAHEHCPAVTAENVRLAVTEIL